MLRAYCPIAVVVITATDIPIKAIMINIDEVSSYLCCVLRNSSAFSPVWTPFEISDFLSTICMFSVLHITLVLCLVLVADLVPVAESWWASPQQSLCSIAFAL